MGPEGAILLNNKDTVIAGTNLFGDDAVSEPGKKTTTSPEGSIKLEKSGDGGMGDVIAAINALVVSLSEIANRPISVQIDGKEVITATTEQNPNAQGNAVATNNFQVQ